MRKHGPKILGLAFTVALALMALSVSAAQAAEELELHARHTAVLRGGTYVPKGTKLAATGEQVAGTGHFLIPGKNLDLKCETAKITEMTLENEEDKEIGPKSEKSISGLVTMGSGKITFEKCKAFDLEGKELAGCTKAFNEHNNLGKPSFTLLLLTALHFHRSTIASEVLETHLEIVKVKPLEGKTEFATWEFGGTCSLPEKFKITGSFAGTIPPLQPDAKSIQITFETGSPLGKIVNALPLIESKLLTGAVEMFFDAKFNIELVSGESFGVM